MCRPVPGHPRGRSSRGPAVFGVVQEDLATGDMDLAVVRQGHDLRPNQLVEVLGQRDAGERLERRHAQLAEVNEHLLVVEGNLDPLLAVVVVVVALAGLFGYGVHLSSQPPGLAAVRTFSGGTPASPFTTA